jgi:dGTPase
LSARPKRSDRFSGRNGIEDNRTPFQRDRDRILFTSAFRRLAGVTQVVSSDEGQIFHNRLTHSLEVAQLGRRLCEKLMKDQPEVALRLAINPDVVEAACMAHDLGHPPFGHVAEVLLDELAVKEGLTDGFEGNPQSFRIVTQLAFHTPDVKGLDLTRATLNAILKYPWFRAAEGRENRKWGAYHAEEPEFLFARELSQELGGQQSAEAEIMDWADDITYSVHDLEDFYQARLIPLHLLMIDKSERQRFFDGAEKRLTGRDIPAFDVLTKAFEELLVESFPTSPEYPLTQEQTSDLRNLTSGLITRYLKGTELRESSDDSEIPGVLAIREEFKHEVRMLKELTWHYVINNPALATQQYGQRKLIKDLFAIYSEIAYDSDKRDWYVFSASTREQLDGLEQHSGKERKRRITRLIVDLIAGMTEKHLVDMHRRLTGMSFGSAMDYLERDYVER